MGESTRDTPPHSLRPPQNAKLSTTAHLPEHTPPKLLTGAVIIPFAVILLLNIKIKLNSRLLQVPVGLLSVFLGARLIVIAIVAIYWFRYIRVQSLKTKYSPKNATPKED